MKKNVINSPIRWAGSKKKLLNEMLNFFKSDAEVYVEPFLGSGVVLINVLNNIEFFEYKKFYVNDINSNIINFYILLKEEYDYVEKNILRILNKYEEITDLLEKEKFYYDIRKKYNEENNKIKAIYFYFLMKAGYNGVYRENKKGEFNVPFGKKEHLSIDFENLKLISQKIQNVEFFNMEYIDFLNLLKEKGHLNKAFVYCDPPYLPEENSVNQKQELYTKKSFDHIKFSEYINKTKKSKIIVSMIDSKISNEIYGSLKKYLLTDIMRTINPKKIFKSTEVLFSNYNIDTLKFKDK